MAYTHEQLLADLSRAVTAWDRRQSNRRGYNIYALGIYLQGVDRVVQAVQEGATARAAIARNFNDRLHDHIVRSLSLPD